MMRIKTASTIVAFPSGKDVTIYNYLTKDAVVCTPQDVYWLTVAAEWTSISDLIDIHPHIPADQVVENLEALVSNGILVAEGSENAAKDSQYRNDWELGPDVCGLPFYNAQF